MNKRKNLVLLLTSIGLFIIAISQIIWHFLEIPDFYNGALIGIGIGLMVFTLVNGRKKQIS